jgi:hypothetical protein
MFITYPQPNGQVAIVIPTGDVSLAIKDVPEGIEYKIVESVDIDNDYFNAYGFDAELGAKVNIEKAKAIHLDKFRAARKPKLDLLDVAFMKAVEAGDEQKKTEIASEKQALRDVTLTPLPNDLAGIKSTWPDILKKNYRKGIAIGIITARDSQNMIYEWLRYHVGFHIDKKLIWAVNDPVHGLSGNIQQRKQDAMKWFIEQGYIDITFFDDDRNNIKLIKKLEKELDVKIKTHLVKK